MGGGGTAKPKEKAGRKQQRSWIFVPRGPKGGKAGKERARRGDGAGKEEASDCLGGGGNSSSRTGKLPQNKKKNKEKNPHKKKKKKNQIADVSIKQATIPENDARGWKASLRKLTPGGENRGIGRITQNGQERNLQSKVGGGGGEYRQFRNKREGAKGPGRYRVVARGPGKPREGERLLRRYSCSFRN